MATQEKLIDAYHMGYTCARYGYDEIKTEMREYAEESSPSQAIHDLWMNGPCLGDRFCEGAAGTQRRIAQDSGDDTQSDREDLDSAFDSGALDAVLGRDANPDSLILLKHAA